MFSKSCAIILFIILNCFELFAQRPVLKFRHFNNEEGLSNSTVDKIIQDDLGFIWVGTSDGLNRFDGYNFEVFRTDLRDKNSISNNYINTIFEDHLHRLWIGTNDGLNRFDRVSHRFIRYYHDKANPNSISNNNVTSVAEDRTGNLWIATVGGGIDVMLINEGRLKHFKHIKSKNSLSNDSVNVIFMDKEGTIWAGTNSGLSRFDRHADSFESVPKINYSIVAINEQNGNLWLGSQYSGVLLFNPKVGVFKQFMHKDSETASIGSNLIKDILVDNSGRIWIGCTNGGLNLYNANNNSFYRYDREPENRFSLSQKSIYTICEDRQGNLWAGTSRGGINLYSPQANKFRLFSQNALGTGLSYDDVRSFYQSNDNIILIGTDGGGISLFNQNGSFLRKYQHNPVDKSSLSSNAILNIAGDKKGHIWISTYGGGLNVYIPGSNKFKSYRHDPLNKNSISSDYVTKVFEDSKSNLWVATTSGLNRFDYYKQEFREVSDDGPGSTEFLGRDFIDVEEDHDNNVWILSLDGGLSKYNLVTGDISHYLRGKTDTKDLAIGFTDSKNRFWIGKKGLYLYDKKMDRFQLYSEKAGLSDEYIKGIEEDDRGNLWISTSNGITELNPSNAQFTKFNTGDGLQGAEFEVKSCMKTKDGEIYFGGINGFNCFYPNKITINKYSSPVFITGLDIFNKQVAVGGMESPLKADIGLTDEIKLNYSQNSIALSFTTLNYVVPENNKFLYKLDGFDNAWVKCDQGHKAVYTNLNPGSYVFHVRASNNDGFWSTYEKTLRINISPPYYATWWFRTLLSLIIGYAAYTLIRFRHKMSMKALEDKKNEEMHQLQLQFFTNISHEFRTPLSLILGPLEKIKEIDFSKKLAPYFHTIDRNANRLLNLIHELMDFNKVASGVLKLRVQKADLCGFLEEIIDEFRHLSENKKLQLITKDVEILGGVWFDPGILEKIILNLINNSFKYTAENGIITVEVFLSADEIKPPFENELIIKNHHRAKKYFYIKVTDNGVGISKKSIAHLFERYYRVNSSHLGSGVGLAFVKSLTLLHKGDIYVFSEIQKGTEIIIALPLGDNSYSNDEKWGQLTAEGLVNFESVLPSGQLTDNPEKAEIQITPDGECIKATEIILLVDDNEELRDFYKKSLGEAYQIIEAIDGQAGIEVAKNGSIDLIVSDIMMPVMNGIDFCKAIRSDIETSHIPFIMLTAKNRLESQIEGVESGADIYLAKPVSLTLLQLSIKNIFEQRRKLRDHYVKDFYAEAKDLVNSTKDREFIEKLFLILDSQIINPELDVDYICREIGMSRTKLYQKIKGLTGQSIVEFIRSFRLKKAIQIMTHEDVSISEVIYRVGIQTHSHFTKSFKKEFGKTPSQFLQEIQRHTH